jgi:release factor glutamine methyltransferase
MSPTTSGDGTMTWRALWIETADRLGSALEARWVCQEVAGLSGPEWAERLDEAVTVRAVARLDALVERRRGGEPLAYVLGSWAFRRLELAVDPRVLIPRPETEDVVEVALGLARTLLATGPLVAADLGTGSGAIALSLATELPPGSVTVWATDVSPDALDVARANVAGAGRAGRFVQVGEGSWFDALPAELAGRLGLVVSNPPYVGVDDADLAPEVRSWEPHGALFAGADGLDAVRVLVAGAGRWLAPGGVLVVEIGHRQAAAAAGLATSAGLVGVEVRPDAAGRDRILVARHPA